MLFYPDSLYHPFLLRQALVVRVHRKRLAFQILSLSTMQWMTFNCRYEDSPSLPSLWTPITCPIQHWLTCLLGAGYSSDCAGDGPRSVAAQRRRNKARRIKYVHKTETRRQQEIQARGSTPTLAPVLSNPAPPQMGTRTRPSLRCTSPPPPSALSFYNAHPGYNKYLDVRMGGNITGSADEKGVFARCLIPPHTRLAPYLGSIRPASTTGPYCLQVRDQVNNLICLDAMHHLYDVGYLHSLSSRQQEHTPSPPNYGRYINSLRPDQVHLEYNALILPDPVEGFSWFYSGAEPISAGEEILADYGNAYWARSRQSSNSLPPKPLARSQSKSHPRVPTSGKAFSSDPIGDGPGHDRSTAWVHLLGAGTTHTYKGGHIVIRTAQAGARIRCSDVTHSFNGRVALPESQIEPLIYQAHGPPGTWISLLHQLYLEEGHNEGLHAFVYRVLLPVLAAIQQQPEDHFLVHLLTKTPISALDGIQIRESALPLLFQGLQLQVALWTPTDAGWCRSFSHSPLDARYHIQLVQGFVTRVYPVTTAHRTLMQQISTSIAQALTGGELSLGTCPIHRGREPAPPPLHGWWHKRLLQFLPEPTSELSGTCLTLYYRTAAITLSQADFKDLHRNYVTHVGVPLRNLVNQVAVVMSMRMVQRSLPSPNPFAASFAATRCFMEDDAELSSYLQEQFAGLLQAPFSERVQAIITSTLSHPTAPLEGDPLMVDTMMDVLRNKPGWALWKSCCPLSSWATQRPHPGMHWTDLGSAVPTNGLASDGATFFGPPNCTDLATLMELFRNGLKESLRHHPLADMVPRYPPLWRQIEPQARVEPQWAHARWIQHLDPDIRATDNMTFCYGDVYVTLDPWSIEAATHQSVGTDPLRGLEQRLQIKDIGYALVDTTHQSCPLHQLGLSLADVPQTLEWLRKHEVSGESLWHRRGLHRASRYLLSHTPVDRDHTDIDLDVLLYLTAKMPLLMVWDGAESHSLAPWIRIHGITPARWYAHQRQQHWALGPDGIMVTSPPVDRISFLIRSLVRVIRGHHPSQGTIWPPPGHPWECLSADVGMIRLMMGPGVRVDNSATGMSFTEENYTITILHASPLHFAYGFTDDFVSDTGSWMQGCVTVKQKTSPSPQPTALMVLYHIYMDEDGSPLLTTTDGRQELRLFIAERLLPRLRRDAPPLFEEPPFPVDHNIMLSFAFLRAVFLWLGHPPGHTWTQGSLDPESLSYLLQDDPEVLFWERRGTRWHFVPWMRDRHPDCSLTDLKHAAMAKWHVGFDSPHYCLLPLQGTPIRLLCIRIEQAARALRVPLTLPPTIEFRDPPTHLAPPPASQVDEVAPNQDTVDGPAVNNADNVGGAGFHLTDLSDAHSIIFTTQEHTISVRKADIAALSTAPTRQDLLDNLPVRLGCRYTRTQWRATPGDGFCGLHALLRIESPIAPEAKQKPDLKAALRSISETLDKRAESEDWEDDSPVPQETRTYLALAKRLLQSGKKFASSEDYMPLDSMRLLVTRHPMPVTLWTPDLGDPEELWLTSGSTFRGLPTMANALTTARSTHLAFSRAHFFQIAVTHDVVCFLIDSLLDAILEVAQPGHNTILPMEVEEGSLLVHRHGANWAVALSRRHRRRLRLDPGLALDPSMTTTHFRPPETVWGSIEGNGYCGYDAIRHILVPGATRFRLADSRMRQTFQLFLQQLIQWIPAEMSEDIRRVREAARNLDNPRLLPRSAWCHIDLVSYFADREKRIFWTAGGTPLHSVRWLGQRCALRPSSDFQALGVAYNSTDHFTVVTPDIPNDLHAEAIRMMKLAISGSLVPYPWQIIEGARVSSSPSASMPLTDPLVMMDPPAAVIPNPALPPPTPPAPARRTQLRLTALASLPIPPSPPPTPKKRQAMMAVRDFLRTRSPPIQLPPPVTSTRPSRNKPKPSYAAQLHFATPKPAWSPIVTPPLHPRSELTDPTAIRDSLYLATSRLGFSLQGVFARRDISFTPRSPHRLCEFRSEKGNIRTDPLAHAAYIAQVTCSKNIVVRGPLLVDGHGNTNSYCTHIQENLRAFHFNCAYVREGSKIWVMQTAHIKANEELSIQYTKDGSYWRDRDGDYPPELYRMACARYALNAPIKVETILPLQAFPLVPPPKADFEDELMSAEYYYHYPPCIQPCSLRIGTVNINGALHSPDDDVLSSLAHLMEAADISVLGITDARIASPDSIRASFRRFLPRGYAVIPFCTTKPYAASHRNTTMGGQLILINRQWEKWAGHHRTDPSGLALVVGLRLTYNTSVLSIIQVMIPPRSKGPHTMWQRLLQYLSKHDNPLQPDEYVIQTAERWAASDKLAGRVVLIMGDFNRSYATLSDWAAINGLSSMSRQLAASKPGCPFATFNGTSTVKSSLIDHIFLQRDSPFFLNSVGGLMHPLFSLITDHNPSWVGLIWPETPPKLLDTVPSPRILNSPDLPNDGESYDLFAYELDAKMYAIMAGSPPLSILTPERAGLLQGKIVQASVATAQDLSRAKPNRTTGKGHRFKDGYSPEFLLLRAALHAYTDISRLLWRHTHRTGRVTRHETELTLIMARWYRVLDTHPEAKNHPNRSLFPTQITLAKYRRERIMDKIGRLKQLLHGRKRKRMRLAMSDRVRDIESLLAAKKLGRLIQKLLPSYAEPLDFNQLRDQDGIPYRTAAAADKAASRTMRDWMAVPDNLNPVADLMERQPDAWKSLLHGTYLPTSNPIPVAVQQAILQAAQAREIPELVKQELHDAMRTPFSFEEFEHCRQHLTTGKSPGPSGLTTTQVKHWGPETTALVFELSQIMWKHHYVPQWWQDRLMTLLPKEPGTHDLNKIRPISLFEVIRKLWAGMVTSRIQRIWHQHGLLHANQHGFRTQHGTHTAILHVLNHLESVGGSSPTHITFWDIRRAFDSVPKWLQRLAWSRLGLSEDDMEWFLQLDSTGRVYVRTPHQQSHITRTTDMATGAMLSPLGHSFHPERGIGQGDTPSTLVFIAVFDILLTLLDSSHTGTSHAYADDLLHLAPSLDLQQKQAALVCGFCAFTGLEISLSKVEAISINHGDILYNTPFLVLYDWHWHPHRVQHQDDSYWTRYLGLFLDKHSCNKHFARARLKLREMCRLLTRKVASPAAKRVVYTLCIKSQVRYPAGLAPWTLQQYLDLDRAPTALLRHIYGLRRSFPTDLIYSPVNLGGCGETRISDAAQLQKWKYLHSTSHLGRAPTEVVTELLDRAIHADITAPSYYCTSLVEWGRRMGLDLLQAQPAQMPSTLLAFLNKAVTPTTRPVYTDGSFSVHAPLLASLTQPQDRLTNGYSTAATGVYLPQSNGSPPLALFIRTPAANATDAYYQELLGITISMLLAQDTPTAAYSDCSSAIKRTCQAMNIMGPAIGHLQHGSLLLGIRHLASNARRPLLLSWTASHPERSKPQQSWTNNDWGIHMADAIAGADDTPASGDLPVDICTSEAIHAALTPEGTWQWREKAGVFHGSLRKRAQQYHFQQYLNKRDMKRIYVNEPSRWSRYCIPLLSALNKATNKSPRHLGRRSKHLYDWMAHAANLSKGAAPHTRVQASLCRFCGVPETQQHINVACAHPPLVETRRTCRRAVDEFFLCYRHQHLPQQDKWIAPLLDHMEANIWLDTPASGDLWNGRWTEDLLQSLLSDYATYCIPQRDLQKTLKRLQTLTALLQRTQRSIYSTRQAELMSMEAGNRRANVIALRQRRVRRKAQTLYAAWRIPYTAPRQHKRRLSVQPPTPPPPSTSHHLQLSYGKWLQYSRARVPQGQPKPTPTPLHSRIAKTSKREDHRARQLELRKLRNFLLQSR
jgi:hypothetical protein